jgi:hypothetical protein
MKIKNTSTDGDVSFVGHFYIVDESTYYLLHNMDPSVYAACLGVRMLRDGLYWTDFLEIWYWWLL